MDHLDGVFDAGNGVVGIDKEGRLGGQVLREGPERLSLGRKRLDVAVGHRSHGVKAVETAGPASSMLLVPTKPTMTESRAAAMPASIPCVRRNPNSTRSIFPSAARRQRAALVASTV